MNNIQTASRYHANRATAIPWKNMSGETVPAFACVKLTDFNDSTFQWVISKPDGEAGLYYANGPVSIASSAYGGSQTWDLPRSVLVNSDDLNVGDEVGPIEDSWEMGSEGSGFRIFRPPEAGVAMVERLGAAADSATLDIRHGLVCRCIGKGWYIVELKEKLGLTPPVSDDLSCEGNGSVDGSEGECDLCNLPSGGEDCETIDFYTECGLPGEFDPQRPRKEMPGDRVCGLTLTGDGRYVFAYDKRAIPLKSGAQVTIRKLTEKAPVLNSDSGQSDDEGAYLYEVLTGEYKMVQIPHEDWECCPDGSVRRVSCTTFLVEGVACTTPDDPCP